MPQNSSGARDWHLWAENSRIQQPCTGHAESNSLNIPYVKKAAFWDVTTCGYCKNRRFGGKFRLHHQDEQNEITKKNVSSMLQLLDTVNVVPSSSILITQIMEELGSSKFSVLIRARQRDIPKDSICHRHRCENLKSYIALTGYAL
jgi:hypothetical protein